MINNTENYDLEEGDEICPICRKINNPGKEIFNCSHFVGLQWDGELYWRNQKIDEIIGEVELIGQATKACINSLPDSTPFKDILNFEDLSIDQIVFELLTPEIVSGPDTQNNTFLSAGGGSNLYIKDTARLDEIFNYLREIKFILNSK